MNNKKKLVSSLDEKEKAKEEESPEEILSPKKINERMRILTLKNKDSVLMIAKK